MAAGRPGFEADRAEREELASRFFDALREGDVDGLRGLLAADVSMVGDGDGDGGGKAPQLARAVAGARNVARLPGPVHARMARIEVTLEPHELNGQPGAVFYERAGMVLHTLALDILDGRVQTIRAVINPDKLRHVGPVADAWAIHREVRASRPLSRVRTPRPLPGTPAPAAPGSPARTRTRAAAAPARSRPSP